MEDSYPNFFHIAEHKLLGGPGSAMVHDGPRTEARPELPGVLAGWLL
jgi:hypothetical protein